jgi:hypothetical protein
MSKREQGPPRWAEVLLERLLPERARETVTGDLREEYADSRMRHGSILAGLGYLCQVLSFVPWFSREGGPMGKILIGVSWLALACTCWLAFMEVVLRHPGFAVRALLALLFAAICLATILVRLLHVGAYGERWLWAGAATLIGFGAEAFIRNAHAAHFEGFVFLISLILVLQGALMLVTLGRPEPNQA